MPMAFRSILSFGQLYTDKPVNMEIRAIIFLFLYSQVQIVLSSDGCDSKEKRSLAFVFDTTASMSTELNQLRAVAHSILDTIIKNPNARIAEFILAPFNDPGYGPAVVTSDPAKFRKALDAITVGSVGNYDCPEMSMSGVALALNNCRDGSFVYVFTDAGAKDRNRVNEVINAAKKKRAQVDIIVSGTDECSEEVDAYERVVQASSGLLFRIRKTDISKVVLAYVKETIDCRRENLVIEHYPKGGSHKHIIPVNEGMDNLTITVAGMKPQVTVQNPNGKVVKDPSKVITALDFDSLKVINVLQPETGDWSITTDSSTAHSAKITAITDLDPDNDFTFSLRSSRVTNEKDEVRTESH